jgi:repressor LexA
MTPKQAAILRFVEHYHGRRGYAPTLQEIADHFRVHKVTVLGHLRRLERSKRIRRPHYRRRGIEVTAPTGRIPVIGRIAAGRPIEAVETPSDLDLAAPLRDDREYFALEVRGDSMIDEQIRDGDFVIAERRSDARDGDTVIALLEEGDATLKRMFREGKRIRLQPANPEMAPIFVDSVRIQGVVVGVYRKMAR